MAHFSRPKMAHFEKTVDIHTISSYHPFVDGNKRTALVAADVCLSLNGHRLAASDDLESFFWSIARGERSVEDIELWVKKQGKPLLPLQQ